jgi:hypothetical protein
MSDMDTVEVKILKYRFLFRQLTWREEFALKFPKDVDRRAVLLAHALDEVSGLKVTDVNEAMKVMKALPPTIVSRVFIVYRGSLPIPRIYTTTGLFKAPEPNAVARVFEQEEEARDKIMDKVEAEMESKFGRKELAEAREVERQMMRNSKLRGATKPTPEPPLPGKK